MRVGRRRASVAPAVVALLLTTACAQPGITVTQAPAPPRLAVAEYLRSLEQPSPTDEVQRWLCAQRRAELLRQRQAFLEQFAARIRSTYPIVHVHADLPDSPAPSGNSAALDVPVWVEAGNPDGTFRTQPLRWRFQVRLDAEGWTICEVQMAAWCGAYQKC